MLEDEDPPGGLASCVGGAEEVETTCLGPDQLSLPPPGGPIWWHWKQKNKRAPKGRNHFKFRTPWMYHIPGKCECKILYSRLPARLRKPPSSHHPALPQP